VPVPTTVIVADNWLAWGIQHVRVGLGLKILYRSQAALGALRVIRHGEALLVLGDDAFGPEPRTHSVHFCGVGARMPAGVVTLARLGQAPIVPFEVLPIAPRRWRIRFGPIVEPPGRESGDDGEQRTLQQLADVWTESVRRNPAHWSARFPIAWEQTA
jgi:lauroyl/myristoyl acyltransferase